MNSISASVPRAAYVLQTPEAQRQASEAAVGFGKSPVKLVEGIAAATAQLFSAAAAASAGVTTRAALDPAAPQLRAPSIGAGRPSPAATGSGEGLTSEAELSLLMAQLQEILGDAMTHSLAERAKAMIERFRAAQASSQQSSQEYQAIVAELEAAVEGMDDALGEVESTSGAASVARGEADRLKAELAAMDPEDPNYGALSERAEQAESKAVAAERVAKAALDGLIAAQKKVDAVTARLEGAQGQMSALRNSRSHFESVGADDLSTAAALGQMIAILNEIGSKMQLMKLEAETEYVTKVLEAGVKANMKRSEEFQEQKEKAADAQSTMGCIGKVVGWVVTVVMVAAAPFTGGASLALAAVGLALMISEEVTGFSVLGEALQPLMTHVLQPLLKELTSLFSGVLQSLGVDAELADKIGAAMAAVFAAAIVIAAIVVGKSAGAKLLGPMIKAVSSQFTKIMPKMLANFSIGASEQAVVRAGYAMTAAEVAGFGMATASGAGRIVVAEMNVNAAEIMGAIQMTMANSAIAQEMLDRANKQFSHGTEVIQSMLVMMSNVAAESEQTSQYVVARMQHA